MLNARRRNTNNLCLPSPSKMSRTAQANEARESRRASQGSRRTRRGSCVPDDLAITGRRALLAKLHAPPPEAPAGSSRSIASSNQGNIKSQRKVSSKPAQCIGECVQEVRTLRQLRHPSALDELLDLRHSLDGPCLWPLAPIVRRNAYQWGEWPPAHASS